jgi:hypothetical protein
MPVTARRMVEGWEMRVEGLEGVLAADDAERHGKALGWEGFMGIGVLNQKAESRKQKFIAGRG